MSGDAALGSRDTAVLRDLVCLGSQRVVVPYVGYSTTIATALQQRHCSPSVGGGLKTLGERYRTVISCVPACDEFAKQAKILSFTLSFIVHRYVPHVPSPTPLGSGLEAKHYRELR